MEKKVQEDENNFKEFLVCFPLKYTPLNNPFYNLLKLKAGGGRGRGFGYQSTY